MLTFLRRNLFWMFVALALSTSLWLIVTLEQNPDVSIPFANVPVQVKDVPEGLAIANEIPPVRVWTIAPQDVAHELRADRVRVEIDAARAGPGIQELPVRVTVLDPRARFERVEPETIALRLDVQRRKEVPVRVNQIGGVAFGYVARPPRVTPSTVVVSGPQSLIEQVVAVVVDVSLGGQRMSISQGFRPQPVNVLGAPIERVVVEPERVLIEVPIEQQVSYKTVPVTPQLIGSVSYGYQIVGILVDPAAVTVVGEPSVLNNIDHLQTRPIDVTGVEGDVAISLDPTLPTGASLLLSQNILVRVLVRPVESSKVIEVAPRVRGVPPALSARVDPPSIQVSVAGALPLLGQLKPEDIEVTVYATGLVTGTHAIKPDVRVPDVLRLVAISPSEVRVTIR